MTLELEQTPRGFAIAEFIDAYNSPCSIQESSIATDDMIWLGCDMVDGARVNTRMHLTRAMVADLLPLLTQFVETGRLTGDGATQP